MQGQDPHAVLLADLLKDSLPSAGLVGESHQACSPELPCVPAQMMRVPLRLNVACARRLWHVGRHGRRQRHGSRPRHLHQHVPV